MHIYKNYISIFFAIPIIFFVTLEYFYQFLPIATNSSEKRILEINKIKEQKIKYAIFGSSVTNGVLGSNPNVYNNTYNGTTVGATTLLGQYFLAQRLLKNNNEIDQIFLSFTPHMLFFDVTKKKNKRVVRFFNNSFKNNYEEMTLKKIDKEYVVDNSYIINRRFYINNLIKKQKLFFNENKKNRNIQNILSKNLEICQKQNDENIAKKILNHSNIINKAKLNPHILYLFNLIKEHSLNNKFILIIEPMPKTVYQKFKVSSLYKDFKNLLQKNNISYFDSNELYNFKDCMFRDQLHLKEKFNLVYEKIILKKYFQLYLKETKGNKKFQERRISDLKKIKKALDLFYKDNKYYPRSHGFDGRFTNWGKSNKDWIKGLSPKYIQSLPEDPRNTINPSLQYLYKSNGKDYKIISHSPENCSILKSSNPNFIDPKRNCWAYGFWTEGAKNW